MVSIVSAVRDLGRLRQIYLVLLRHGFGELAQRLGFGSKRAKAAAALDSAEKAITGQTPGSEDISQSIDVADVESEAKRGEEERKTISLPERVRLVLMDLGPSFVKLGQIASTRPDVIPQDWIAELKKLQDEVTPLGFDDIKSAVETSLGAPLAELFESFEQKPLAAASIGQVHRAKLIHPDGSKEVVVKVQRPGVRQTVARDLDLLHALAKVIERTVPESHIYSPCALVDQFDRAITSELDFSLEAEHADRFTRNFQGHDNVRFPHVYKDASTKSVLTLEFLPGCKVYEAIAERGHSGPRIAKDAVGIVIKMIFEDGFFHADPHPGNILISGEPERPVFGLIDLGMVGRLSPEMRDRTVDLMIAAIRQDHIALADALWAIGTPTKKVDMRAYRTHVSILSEKYIGRPLKEIDLAAMISDLVQGATKFGLEVPPDFLLVGKALMTIEGVGKEIYPDLDVFTEAKPFFLELLRKRYSPERVGNELWRGFEKLSSAAYDLPQQVREILDDMRLGRLSFRTMDPTMPAMLNRLGRRLFTGLVASSLVLSGTWLLAAKSYETVGFVLIGFGVVFLLGHIALDLIRRA